MLHGINGQCGCRRFDHNGDGLAERSFLFEHDRHREFDARPVHDGALQLRQDEQFARTIQTVIRPALNRECPLAGEGCDIAGIPFGR